MFSGINCRELLGETSAACMASSCQIILHTTTCCFRSTAIPHSSPASLYKETTAHFINAWRKKKHILGARSTCFFIVRSFGVLDCYRPSHHIFLSSSFPKISEKPHKSIYILLSIQCSVRTHFFKGPNQSSITQKLHMPKGDGLSAVRQ